MSDYSESESYQSDSSSDSTSSVDDIQSQENLDSLLSKARTNLSSGNADNLELNEDVVRFDSLDDDDEKPIPRLTSKYNLDTLPALKPSQRRSQKAKENAPKSRQLELSAIEHQTRDALDNAAAAMSSRPAHDAGIRPSRKQMKEAREATTGKDWFDLPAPPAALLPEWKREAEALQLRNSLDPKRFYKGGSKLKLPKHFAIGRILPGRNAGDSLAEGAEDSKARRQARGFVNELLDDKTSQRYSKRKYSELQAERGQEYGQKKKAKETLKKMERKRR
ncbi:Fcf2-domain-containing protein [Wallemia mellicola]|uniref:Fcf2-domain-containing protein n=2 Tax=Wallemia mellicola TaxID=1708541 RepID=I4Y7S3_WALMC|nr:Fcf2-domain-containing protein [Wallemia mellicola CBS 633.66]TIB70261.1 hypothetical protein E3Q24_03066 [Wallemia mellicola]EIM20015.1 Fcf2-domain-containing protein [Wallemia mellicola CBS 633.66]TIB77088.1 Fcf2-domain-containing protein [Wallemia mellicola]TIB82903.1 Fcf2-domain-containing protein [Wallemia mellicola]TIC02992.1 Fcf2-domain-containing protein [Wallemia mellicola]|eukprot:XP_006959945.1 Fcf2-domain-containing protein [Wallemia mellicola CBS 633.66]